MQKRILGIVIIALAVVLLLTLVSLKEDSDEKDAFLCEAVHSNPTIEMSQCPVHQQNDSWLLTFLFSIGFLLVGLGSYMIITGGKAFSAKTAEQEGFREIDLSTLNDEEKTVYALLKEHQGSMYQSDVIKTTGFPKVKITRILDRLEHNNILERKRRGMTNIIVLK